MFRLDVLHEQWVTLALGAGLVVTLAFVLYGHAMSRSRGQVATDLDGGAGPVRDRIRRLLVAVPWLLLMTILAITAWALVMPLLAANDPPNW